MATYYIDFEGGNDANAGTSFATRWKTITNGATAARIAPGDEIRIMASPDPTSIGTATWHAGYMPAQYVSGTTSGSISSSTNANPTIITTSSTHNLVVGDYVQIYNHNTNTYANGMWYVSSVPTATSFGISLLDNSATVAANGAGSSGYWRKINNAIIKTSAALVRNVALCGGLGQKPAWTASTDVSCTQNTSIYREGYSALQITINTGFTTGKAAYYTLPATLDLSAYKQLSFWMRQTSGTLHSTTGAIRIALCSDTTGDTVVDYFDITPLGATNQWVPMALSTSNAAIGSSIRSIAFYVATDNGSQTFILDNFVACKPATSADSITNVSLVSKNGANDSWYPLQAINGNAVIVSSGHKQSGIDIRGYYEAAATTTTYKRETTKLPPSSGYYNSVNSLQNNGNVSSPITILGGWNRTDMSTQTGETWYDGQNYFGSGINGNSKTDWYVDKVNFVRFNYGMYNSNTVRFSIGTMHSIGNGGYGLNGAYVFTASKLYGNNNESGAIAFDQTGGFVDVVQNASNTQAQGVYLNGNCSINRVENAHNNANYGVTLAGVSPYIGYVSAIGNRSIGIYGQYCTNGVVNGGNSSENGAGAQAYGGTLYINDFTSTEANDLLVYNGILYVNRLDDTDYNSWVKSELGTVNQQTAVVDSPAVSAWRMAPTFVFNSAQNPLRLKLGTVVCAAGSLVTVTARMRRDNTGLTMRLVCPGGQIKGVGTNVTSDMTAAANTWETVTITFTPTKAGAVDIYAHAFGGTTYYGYVCNLTASQA